MCLYWASSSPLSPGHLKIAFNIESLPVTFWGSEVTGTEQRLGLASGWLDRIATKMISTGDKVEVSLFSVEGREGGSNG